MRNVHDVLDDLLAEFLSNPQLGAIPQPQDDSLANPDRLVFVVPFCARGPGDFDSDEEYRQVRLEAGCFPNLPDDLRRWPEDPVEPLLAPDAPFDPDRPVANLGEYCLEIAAERGIVDATPVSTSGPARRRPGRPSALPRPQATTYCPRARSSPKGGTISSTEASIIRSMRTSTAASHARPSGPAPRVTARPESIAARGGTSAARSPTAHPSAVRRVGPNPGKPHRAGLRIGSPRARASTAPSRKVPPRFSANAPIARAARLRGGRPGRCPPPPGGGGPQSAQTR